MITTPVDKQRSKSYYMGNHEGRKHHEDNKSLGHHSVRMDQKKPSTSKFRKNRNKSMERDTSMNHSKFFKNPPKPAKRVHIRLFRISPATNQSTSLWINHRAAIISHPKNTTKYRMKTLEDPERKATNKKLESEWQNDPIKAATW